MHRGCRSLFRNESGNVSVMAAFAAVPLIAAAGASVDWMRFNDTRTELYAAMDGAVLAGTQALVENGKNEAAAIAEANRFFDASIDRSRFSLADVKFKINKKKNGVAAYGQAEVDTSLLKLVGIDSMRVLSPNVEEAVVAEAGGGTPSGDLEISVMLDVTGSMCADNTGPCTSGPKMSALKSAANELVDTVIWEDQSTYTSKIAIVPFSTRVRVAPDGAGSAIMKKLTNLEPNWSGWFKTCLSGSGGGGSEVDGGWVCNQEQVIQQSNWKLMPCVTDRFYNATQSFELTDTAPGAGYWLNAHDGGRMTDGEDSSSTKATTALGKKKADPATFWNYDTTGKCYDVAASNEVMPLTNDKAELKGKIDSLEAFGSTGGVLGTAFSWYMLSPEWKNVWTGQSQPKSYSLLTQLNSSGRPKLRKIAILMTDGSYNTFRGWKGQDINMVSANAKQMCANMKAKGIEIYTVGFDLDSLPANEAPVAKAMLQSCGSSVNHFYDSLDPAQLKQAFQEIGQNVSEVTTRLTR